jgi:cytochrome c553
LRVAILLLAALVLPAESFGDAKAGEKKAQLCLLCHKVAHASAPMSRIPLLEGQPARYLYLQTKAFKEKRRDDYAMQTNTANVSDKDMRDIAEYLSGLRQPQGSYQLDPATVAVGKALAADFKCGTCHLPTYSGADEVPRLAGQTPGYLRAQLEAFGSGKRPHGVGQRSARAILLSEQALDGLAQFLASLE